MKKSFQQILPQNFPITPIYAYSGQKNDGEITAFPGPTIIAKKNIPIKIVWINNITEKHILPIDFNEPFNKTFPFKKQVPVVPHVHGLAIKTISDGLPNAFWTYQGLKSQDYHTEQSCNKNQAVYIYTNEQDSGVYWYHDHAYGITRLNVYAGLAGFYQIIENQQTFQQKRIKQNYGNLDKLYFAIADKSFKKNGELYYPNKAESKYYTTWVPQFFGNTITVNGKVWPRLQLQKKKYRLIFLNACQCRYLNIYFLSYGQKIPFQLIKIQSDYFSQPIITTQYFLSLGARLQIILDLTNINNDILMKNNAPAPHPIGQDDFLVDQFTGTIMKISIKQQITVYNILKYIKIKKQKRLPLKYKSKYPAFQQGQHVYTNLIQLFDEDIQSVGILIDGVSMKLGKNCQGATYQIGKVYDFHIINLTPDTHPIHFHLVSMQKIKSYKIKANQYQTAWYALNGGKPGKGGFNHIPKSLNPLSYKTGTIINPKNYEKVFRDVIDANPYMVTVVRIKFSLNSGKPFSFNTTRSKYVYHCHMLQHQDNQMMKYFCLK